ncbi:MAG: HEAT repeat domain-containing protein [Elusimicrobia bacterium]|nr:HEAT repeat domain-containing protein [Elusimicrobiota bacterium]
MLLFAAILGMTTQLYAADLPPAPANKPADLGKKALAVLASAMTDKDPEVRAAAATAWGLIGNPAAVKLLGKAVRDRNAHVRIEAAYSLHLLGDESGVLVMERILRPSTPTAEGYTPENELQLIARAKSRVHAIRRLTEVGGEKVVDLFDKLRKDPSGEVRDAISIALARMDLGEEFEAPFLDATTDADEGVRAAAVRALAEIGRGRALDALNEAAADPSVEVRAEAMRALAKFSSPDTVRLLAKGARDQDRRVAAQALAGLAHIPDGETAELLREVLKGSKAPEVQLKAMAGLSRRGDKVDLELPDAALRQKDPDLRALALDVLDAVATPASDLLLGRTMEGDADGRLRVQAASILVRRLSRKAGTR